MLWRSFVKKNKSKHDILGIYLMMALKLKLLLKDIMNIEDGYYNAQMDKVILKVEFCY